MGAVSPMGALCGSRNRGVEAKVTRVAIVPSDPLRIYTFLPSTLRSWV